MALNIRARILRGLTSLKLEGDKFEEFATVILRVPGYFILDYWYQHDLLNCVPRSLAWPDIVSAGFVLLAVIQGVLVLLLPLEQLVSLYMHYLTIAVLAAADTFSRYYVETEVKLVEEFPDYGTVSFQGFSNILILQKTLFDPHNGIGALFLRQQVAAIVFHTGVATMVTFFLDLEANKDKILLLVYLIPVFGRLAGCPIEGLHLTHNFASCFLIFLTVQYLFLCVPHIFRFLRALYSSLYIMFHWYGLFGVFIKLWYRLFIPIQLLLFWGMLFITQVYSHLIYEHYSKKIPNLSKDVSDGRSAFENSITDIKMFVTNIEEGISSQLPKGGGQQMELVGQMWYLLLVQSAAEVCYTPMMLGGACVTISYISRGVLRLTRYFASGPSSPPLPEDLAYSGWTEGVTMALLALQTSLLSIPMPERLAVLSIILLIVISSLVQSMLELIEPLVLSLSTQGMAPIGRHIRAWIICLVLLFLPLYMVHTFTLIFDQDFWLLLVASTSIMTSVQVVGLITTYILLTWDAIASNPWPSLDDYIYYAKGITRVFEFLVAVFIVGAGVKETILGQWSWINAIVLIIHCYFNVWQRLQQGWRGFLLRMEAASKISSLPNATALDIEKYSDLCAICYSEMTSACITRCNHLFHTACLRKWLYVQDKCPMCHASISFSKDEGKSDVVDSPQPSPNIETEVGNNIPFVDDLDEDEFSGFDAPVDQT